MTTTTRRPDEQGERGDECANYSEAIRLTW